MQLMSRRFGTLRVSEEVYYSFWKFVKELDFVPFRIEFKQIDKCFHIECECSLFDKLEEYSVIPDYYLVIERRVIGKSKNKKDITAPFIKGVKRLN